MHSTKTDSENTVEISENGGILGCWSHLRAYRRPTSFDNLPRINQRREVETDNIHLQFGTISPPDHRRPPMPDPMPWSPRRKIALALVIAFVGFGLGVFFWRNTAGISGEVFIVTDGKAVVMPGASVRLLKVSESQASKISSNLGEKLHAYAKEMDKHLSALMSSPDEHTTARLKSLENRSGQKYCLELQSLGTGVHGEYITGMIKLPRGSVSEGTIKAAFESSDGIKLQVAFGYDQTALIEEWQVYNE